MNSESWTRSFWLVIVGFLGTVVIAGTTAAQTEQTNAQPASEQVAPSNPDFRSGVALVRTDVIVRDGGGGFIADLTPDDFMIEEDGIPRDVASLVLVNGGRSLSQRRKTRGQQLPDGSSSYTSTNFTFGQPTRQRFVVSSSR